MDIQGKFIGVAEKSNVFALKKSFMLSSARKATLRATALGAYFATINGKRVGDAFLAPGWTSFSKMLQVQEYDVTSLVGEGENEIVFTVGLGWYGGMGWDIPIFYGEHTAVLAELTVDGVTICTDESWQACESPIRKSGIYYGEMVDLTAECKRLTPVEVAYDKSLLVNQICESVRTTERLSVKEIIITPKGERVYDFGQNFSGVVEIKTPEDFDGTITMKFAEILNKGNFYTDNLRKAEAIEIFTAKGAHTYSAELTFHGFRYMKMEGAELPAESVCGLVRHTDMRRTGYLTTGNPRFDRFLQNVVWGQRGNFLDIPTDCPQRDERCGWTGDINGFCRTAAYQYDVRLILKKWLNDLRNDQGEDGGIPLIAPDLLELKETRAMWCDAIVMVPWTLYEMYGDESFLSENYEAIKKYLAAREARSGGKLAMDGPEFGDWLTAEKNPWTGEPMPETNVYYITNVFHAATLKLGAQIAHVLGKEEDAKAYSARREKLIRDFREEYCDAEGMPKLQSVTSKVIALRFEMIEESKRKELARRLNEQIKELNYCITTGFIGTEFVLFVLDDFGYFETARRLLLNNAFPGWLYEVDMGATTIWERWNSLLPDGSTEDGGMNSFNHYALGASAEFVYRRIAGIEAAKPGFAEILFAPKPAKGLPCVRGEYDSVSGKIVAGYESKGGKITFFVQLPDGVPATIALPGESPVKVTGGTYRFERDWEDLACAPFTAESKVIELLANPKAVRVFDAALCGVFTNEQSRELLRGKTLADVADYLKETRKLSRSEFDALLICANAEFEKI